MKTLLMVVCFIRNIGLLSFMFVVLIGFFPTVQADVLSLVDNYSTMPDSLKVIIVTGLAASAYCLTLLDYALIKHIANKVKHGEN